MLLTVYLCITKTYFSLIKTIKDFNYIIIIGQYGHNGLIIIINQICHPGESGQDSRNTAYVSLPGYPFFAEKWHYAGGLAVLSQFLRVRDQGGGKMA